MTDKAKKWMQKYYPVPSAIVPTDRATWHALQKWRGLSNLYAYGLHKDSLGYDILDDKGEVIMHIDGRTCAYCHLYLRTRSANRNRCAQCPITRHTGRPCDDAHSSPYTYWLRCGNPRPMLALLTEIHQEEEATSIHNRRHKGYHEIL